MSSARIVEVEDVAAGIAVPVAPGSVRFFAAETIFDPLERRSFRSVDGAVRAARDLLARRSGPPRHAAAGSAPAVPGPSLPQP